MVGPEATHRGLEIVSLVILAIEVIYHNWIWPTQQDGSRKLITTKM